MLLLGVEGLGLGFRVLGVTVRSKPYYVRTRVTRDVLRRRTVFVPDIS